MPLSKEATILARIRAKLKTIEGSGSTKEEQGIRNERNDPLLRQIKSMGINAKDLKRNVSQ